MLSDGNWLQVPNMTRFLFICKRHDEIGHFGIEKCCKLVGTIYWFHEIFLALLRNTQNLREGRKGSYKNSKETGST